MGCWTRGIGYWPTAIFEKPWTEDTPFMRKPFGVKHGWYKILRVIPNPWSWNFSCKSQSIQTSLSSMCLACLWAIISIHTAARCLLRAWPCPNACLSLCLACLWAIKSIHTAARDQLISFWIITEVIMIIISDSVLSLSMALFLVTIYVSNCDCLL